jgi:hypothetical protein
MLKKQALFGLPCEIENGGRAFSVSAGFGHDKDLCIVSPSVMLCYPFAPKPFNSEAMVCQPKNRIVDRDRPNTDRD